MQLPEELRWKVQTFLSTPTADIMREHIKHFPFQAYESWAKMRWLRMASLIQKMHEFEDTDENLSVNIKDVSRLICFSKVCF